MTCDKHNIVAFERDHEHGDKGFYLDLFAFKKYSENGHEFQFIGNQEFKIFQG